MISPSAVPSSSADLKPVGASQSRSPGRQGTTSSHLLEASAANNRQAHQPKKRKRKKKIRSFIAKHWLIHSKDSQISFHNPASSPQRHFAPLSKVTGWGLKTLDVDYSLGSGIRHDLPLGHIHYIPFCAKTGECCK